VRRLPTSWFRSGRREKTIGKGRDGDLDAEEGNAAVVSVKGRIDAVTAPEFEKGYRR